MPDKTGREKDLPALIHAPLGRDGEAIARALEPAGISARLCPDLDGLEAALAEGEQARASSVIVSEEGAGRRAGALLQAFKAEEPAWSNLPLLFLAADPEDPPPACRLLRAVDPPPTFIVLRRPVRSDLLRQIALTHRQARRRQFETRDLLDRLADGERRQSFLLRELRHRTGNTMAVLQGVFRLTARRAASVEDLAGRFAARLESMARAHETLSNEDSAGDLHDILRAQVAPYTLDPGQLELDGPEQPLQGRLGFDLSVVLHELATNAAKYGALSRPEGRVSVRWRRSGGRLRIDWVERGGPEVARGLRTGLGSQLIAGTNFPTGSTVNSAFEPAGFEWHADIALPGA